MTSTPPVRAEKGVGGRRGPTLTPLPQRFQTRHQQPSFTHHEDGGKTWAQGQSHHPATPTKHWAWEPPCLHGDGTPRWGETSWRSRAPCPQGCPHLQPGSPEGIYTPQTKGAHNGLSTSPRGCPKAGVQPRVQKQSSPGSGFWCEIPISNPVTLLSLLHNCPRLPRGY